jgi:tetratricopeptide (TPR) repeat protein
MRARFLWRLLALAAAVVANVHAAPNALIGFSAQLDGQWDYANPSASEERFRAELARWPAGDPQALIVATQIARAQGLRHRFAEAHATLDGVAARLDTAPSHVRIRYLLERGRAFNSAGSRERAVPLFAEALSLAECADDEFYAVDAAHMLGIASPPGEALGWNLKALALAGKAADPRARRWDASLYNNIGWTWHERGDDATALAYWEKALAARKAAGDARRTRETDWTVARGLRALGRFDEAQAIQLSLVAELDRIGESDGYVFEELAEISLARGDAAGARIWAAKAHAALKDDASLKENEPARLARLTAVAEGRVASPPPAP